MAKDKFNVLNVDLQWKTPRPGAIAVCKSTRDMENVCKNVYMPASRRQPVFEIIVEGIIKFCEHAILARDAFAEKSNKAEMPTPQQPIDSGENGKRTSKTQEWLS